MVGEAGTVTISPEEAAAFHRQRDAATEEVIQQAGEQAPAPEEPPPPTTEVVIIDEESNQVAIDLVCYLLQQEAGGAQVAEDKRKLINKLTLPAAVKYGGRIPYMEEICFGLGVAILLRETFFKSDDEPTEREAA